MHSSTPSIAKNFIKTLVLEIPRENDLHVLILTIRRVSVAKLKRVGRLYSDCENNDPR